MVGSNGLCCSEKMNLICKDLGLLSTSKVSDTFLKLVFTAAVFDGFYHKISNVFIQFVVST